MSDLTSTSKHPAPGLGSGAGVVPPCLTLQAPQNILPWGLGPGAEAAPPCPALQAPQNILPWVGPRCGGCTVSNPTSTSKHPALGSCPGAKVVSLPRTLQAPQNILPWGRAPVGAKVVSLRRTLQAPQNILPWGRAPVRRSFLRAQPYKHLKTSCPGVVPRCEGRFSVPNLTSTSKHPALGVGPQCGSCSSVPNPTSTSKHSALAGCVLIRFSLMCPFTDLFDLWPVSLMYATFPLYPVLCPVRVLFSLGEGWMEVMWGLLYENNTETKLNPFAVDTSLLLS